MTIDPTVIGSGVVMATGISVGYVVWMTRGGLLLLTLVSSMPAWRLVDPIPVLGRLRDKRDEEDEAGESLRSLVEGDTPKDGKDERVEDEHSGAQRAAEATPTASDTSDPSDSVALRGDPQTAW